MNLKYNSKKINKEFKLTIFSMTGFSRYSTEIDLEGKLYCASFEIKSVNGKNLDVKFRLPQGWDMLSLRLKNILSRYMVRGNVSVSLDLKALCGNENRRVNEAWLSEVAQQAIMLYQKFPDCLQKPDVAGLLQVHGVIENEETTENDDDKEKLAGELEKAFEVLCQKFRETCAEEGKRIGAALLQILGKIETLSQRVALIAEEVPQRQESRLKEQLKIWLAPENMPDENRLAQEIVFYVTKADIKEEADRLLAHCEAAKELLQKGGSVGRRLDFLCQELNREANTTCSKSCDLDLTNLGMDLKAFIEQFREQVQNIE